ncbi:hypothetical protein K439DRAFT_1624559 [Ramaria rubella]|nr:hypothetical protein K439DRAFT_1624559 [Ramaria rubella]
MWFFEHLVCFLLFSLLVLTLWYSSGGVLGSGAWIPKTISQMNEQYLAVPQWFLLVIHYLSALVSWVVLMAGIFRLRVCLECPGAHLWPYRQDSRPFYFCVKERQHIPM